MKAPSTSSRSDESGTYSNNPNGISGGIHISEAFFDDDTSFIDVENASPAPTSSFLRRLQRMHQRNLPTPRQHPSSACTIRLRLLGARLEFQYAAAKEEGDEEAAEQAKPFRKNAALTYLASARLKCLVNIWADELGEEEKQFPEGGEGSYFSAHVNALQTFVEKVATFHGSLLLHRCIGRRHQQSPTPRQTLLQHLRRNDGRRNRGREGFA
ncbi:hypothetical protein DFP72DRAFT_176197 [Ephemerocybe angulata]|uniref:Uncharacterized protein n=1 Tax=Ephemerocybe angulata TaxID=980116 RepID=A0A8H6I4N2_9AGAR|nr:hypothetical protein DFP72DRAFT_176197 [Tulosesus angulatus]